MSLHGRSFNQRARYRRSSIEIGFPGVHENTESFISEVADHLQMSVEDVRKMWKVLSALHFMHMDMPQYFRAKIYGLFPAFSYRVNIRRLAIAMYHDDQSVVSRQQTEVTLLDEALSECQEYQAQKEYFSNPQNMHYAKGRFKIYDGRKFRESRKYRKDFPSNGES